VSVRPATRPPIRLYTALLSNVYYAVKTVVDPTILPNSGLARPITVTAPLGTVMNATHPAAVNGRTSTCQRAADLVIGALAQAAPERCIAAGNGSCATASFAGADPKDGLDGVHVHLTNTSNLPVEALEVEYPLTVLRYELVDGSGGAGRSRGGMGLRRVYRARGGMSFAARRLALVDAALGARGRPRWRMRRLPLQRRRRALGRRCRQIARRRDGRNRHSRRRRLWPTCRARSMRVRSL